MSNIISFLPDYLLFLICAVILFVIYIYLPDEVKNPIKIFIKNWGFYIVLVLAWFYFRNKWGIVAEAEWIGQMKYATFLALLVGLLYFAGKSWLYEQRYNTNHFIANNISGSCVRRQDIGDYTVFFLDTAGSSSEKMVFPWPFAGRIVVTPKDGWEFRGSHIHAVTQVFHTELLELPEIVAHFVDTDPFARMCKDKIFFGLFSEEKRTQDPKANDVESYQKDYNTITNLKTNMIRGKDNIIKEHVTNMEAVKKKLRGEQRQQIVLNNQGGMEE